MRTRRTFLPLLAALAAVPLTGPARAQGWPQRPVKLIVPFAAGGNTDVIARIVAQRLGEAFGQQFVVENRSGAGGARGAEAVARSPADGYTLFLTPASVIAILPAVAKITYDPVKDFAPISVIGTNPFVLVVHHSIPVNTLGEFVDYVGERPNELSYVVATFGGLGHLSMATFLKRAGLDVIPVTYSLGGAAPMTDVIGGHVPIFFATLSEAVPHATTGALRLLAVSSEKRIPQLPDIPTFIESGFPGFKSLTWNGLLAPTGTPPDIIDKIAKELADAAKDQKFTERLAAIGVDALGNTPAEFAAMIAADIPFFAEAAKIANAYEK